MAENGLSAQKDIAQGNTLGIMSEDFSPLRAVA